MYTVRKIKEKTNRMGEKNSMLSKIKQSKHKNLQKQVWVLKNKINGGKQKIKRCERPFVFFRPFFSSHLFTAATAAHRRR